MHVLTRSRLLALGMLTALVLGGLVITTPPGSAGTPTSFTVTVPGASDSVMSMRMAGTTTVQGLVFEYENLNTLGFAVRRAEAWSIKSDDVSGAGVDLRDPDLCHLGGSSWAVVGEVTADQDLRFYRSTDDGATWSLRHTFENTTWDGGLDCFDATRLAVVEKDNNGVAVDRATRFWKTVDSGDTWTGGFSLTDDAGSPFGSGTEWSHQTYSADVAWASASAVRSHISSILPGNSIKHSYAGSGDGGNFFNAPPTELLSFSDSGPAGGVSGIHRGRDSNWYACSEEDPAFFVVRCFKNDAQSGSGLSQSSQNWRCSDTHCAVYGNSDGGVLLAGRQEGVTKSLFYKDDGTMPQDVDVVFTAAGTGHGQFTGFLTQTEAFMAYRDDTQGGRLEVAIAPVPGGSGGGTATNDEALAPVTAGVGLAVEPGGFTVLIRQNSGTTVSAHNGGNLQQENAVTTANCGRTGGVDALAQQVAYVTCLVGGDADQIEIRNRILGPSNVPSGCKPGACVDSIDLNDVDLDVQDLHHLNGFRFDYENRHDGEKKFFGDLIAIDSVVFAWAFSTFDNEVGVLMKATRDSEVGAVDFTDTDGILGIGTDGAVDDVCAWRQGGRFHVAFVEAGVGAFRVEATLDVEINNENEVTGIDVELIGDGSPYPAIYSQSTSVDCAGSLVILGGGGKVTVLNALSRQIIWQHTGITNAVKGVAMSDDGSYFAYIDGATVKVANYTGDVFLEYPLPSGSFVDMAMDETGTNIWSLTSNFIHRRATDKDILAPTGEPEFCIGIENETELDQCKTDNPLCRHDTDGDGILDCEDDDICGDGVLNKDSDDDDCDGVRDCEDVDHPQFGHCTTTQTGGTGPGGRLGDPQFPGVDFESLDGTFGASSESWAWIIGTLIVVGGLSVGVAIGARFGRAAVAALGIGGGAIGMVLSVAFSLWSPWALVIVVFLVAAALFIRSRL